MASPVPAPTKIRFDAFELDASTGELRKSGILLKLQPQPFRILLLLVERAGHLVTREEIQRCLWRDSTFVDFEHGINFSINQIRGALADNAEKPCYIETLPRRGYRFIGTVGQPPSVNITVLKRRQEALPEEAAPRRWLKPAHKKNMIVVACVPFLAVAFAAYHFWPRPSPPNSPAKITQISQWNKPMNNASLSPDGHAVAFVSPVSGIEQVFLMLTSGAEPLQLTNDEGDKEVDAFSSDGKEIYYVRSFGRDEVWAVPTLGGTPRRVVVSGRGVVPSSDGAFIYYKKSDSAGIFRAEKSGLNEELVYNSEDANRYFVPLLLFPGDSELLAAGVRQGSPNVRILRINLSSHETVDLGEIAVGGNGKAWAEPGKTLLFTHTVNGLTNIWKYSLQDRSLTQITFGTGPDYTPMPDPGGKGIYYVNGKSSGSLTAYHVQSKESKEIVLEDATQPIISRDGKHVMYITLPAPRKSELWVSDIDGGNKVKIATGEVLLTGLWAPDNFHLSFGEYRTSAGDKAYIVGADGSGLRQLPPMGGMPLSFWSPDEKTIYVSSVQKAAPTSSIWEWSVDGSNPEKIVDSCGDVSDADPSGQYLLGAVSAGEKTGIYEVSIADRKCIQLLSGVVTFLPSFARDGKSFLYAVASRDEVTIFRQPWRDGKLTGAAQVALKVPFAFPLDYAGGNTYDFSMDLSTIVFARPGGHADLYLLSQE